MTDERSKAGELVMVMAAAGLTVLVCFLSWEGIERTLAPDDAPRRTASTTRAASPPAC